MGQANLNIEHYQNKTGDRNRKIKWKKSKLKTLGQEPRCQDRYRICIFGSEQTLDNNQPADYRE